MTRVAVDRPVVDYGVVVGPLRRSVNQAQSIRGSIHNDDVASKLGFRGGTVAGSIHLELFPPLLIDALGEHWFERGTLSMKFRNPTTDREPVRATVGLPSADLRDAQVDVKIEREDGLLIGDGTASIGAPGIPTALGSIDHTRFEAGELRILDGVRAGDEIEEAEIHMAAEPQTARRDVITEPLERYFDPNEPIASPNTIVHYLYEHPSSIVGRGAGRAVGLFGAIEVRHVNGPLILDRTYRVGGRVVAVGQSPRTEYVWFESYASNDSGVHVAEMLMQLRWMKESSPLYTG